jgi:hypothetical protein
MKKIFLYALVASVALASCQKYIDVNVNPNTPTVTKANLVFANAMNSSARIMVGGMHITAGHWTGYYAHSTSFTGGGEEKTYVFTNNSFNYFDGIYDNLTDYNYVIEHAVADGFPHLVGPAMIMQTMMWQKLVDMYGNVPYSEALQGTKFVTPKYDDAATIYQSLVAKLTAAVTLINATTFPSNEPADIIFNANATRWKQFANTLKLRLIVRRSNVPGYNPAADIASISGDGFIDAVVLSNPGYTKTVGKLNQYYQNWGFNENDAPTGDFRKMNNAIIEWLKASSDIFRLSRIASVKGDPDNATDVNSATAQNPANYFAAPLGGVNTPNCYLSACVSAMGRMQIVKGQATRPLIIMTDAESWLLQAEARQRGWIAGSAQAAYEEGVRRDFNIVANTYAPAFATATVAQANAAANAYLSSGVAYADWNASPDKLKAIWVQKWIALANIDGSEAWAEYRRATSPTNLNGSLPPGYTAHSVAVTGPEPVRLFYPLREENVNGANVPQGISIFTSRIFWDVN